MLDVNNEELVPLAGAWKLVPGRPHSGTPIRWALRGVRGVKLETVVVGGRRYTTRPAIARFIRLLTEPHECSHAPSSSRHPSESALDREGF